MRGELVRFIPVCHLEDKPILTTKTDRSARIMVLGFSLSVCIISTIVPALAEAEGSLATPQNAFGLAFYKKLVETDSKKNIAVSPLSLHSCLRLVLNGAAGLTASETATVLGLKGKTTDQSNADYKKLIDLLQPDATSKSSSHQPDAPANVEKSDAEKQSTTGKDSGERDLTYKPKTELKTEPKAELKTESKPEPQAEPKDSQTAPKSDNAESTTGLNEKPSQPVELAVSVWANSQVQLVPDFITTAKKYMDAEVSNIDFSTKGSAEAINSWVNKKTHGKIEKIVENISPKDSIVLASAAYLKSNWQRRFDKASTKTGDFHTPTGMKPVPLMQIKGNFQYFEDDRLQLVDLPYSDEQSGMLVFLPAKKSNLADFAKTLSLSKWQEWKGKLESRRGELKIPRFSVADERDCDGTLTSMGMKTAFSNHADFRKMVRAPAAIPLSNVLHKTFVKVDEDGTEAAAVTATVSKALMEPPPFKMVLDRPFFFAVVNWKTGAILFLGQINSPAES